MIRSGADGSENARSTAITSGRLASSAALPWAPSRRTMSFAVVTRVRPAPSRGLEQIGRVLVREDMVIGKGAGQAEFGADRANRGEELVGIADRRERKHPATCETVGVARREPGPLYRLGGTGSETHHPVGRIAVADLEERGGVPQLVEDGCAHGAGRDQPAGCRGPGGRRRRGARSRNGAARSGSRRP